MIRSGQPAPTFATGLKPFLEHYLVKGIVVTPESETKWRPALAPLGIEPKEVGGVLFYAVSIASSSATSQANG